MAQSRNEDASVGVFADDAVGTAGVGDAPVAAGVTDVLADLDALPIADHVARFEALHDVLRARLAGEPVDGGTA